MTKNKTCWDCPLICGLIAAGECIDLNYERLGYIKVGAVEKMKKKTGKDENEISATCQSCPNLPL